MAREPARWAGPLLGAASAGYSVRAPGPHPPSQSHRSLGRLPAPRSRSQSAMSHREANGRVPLVPTSRTEIGNGRSSDAARADLPSRSDAESMFRGRLCPSLPPRARIRTSARCATAASLHQSQIFLDLLGKSISNVPRASAVPLDDLLRRIAVRCAPRPPSQAPA